MEAEEPIRTNPVTAAAKQRREHPTCDDVDTEVIAQRRALRSRNRSKSHRRISRSERLRGIRPCGFNREGARAVHAG